MQSPKFGAKRRDLEKIVDVPTLKWTWKKKVREAARRQTVPDAIDHLDFHCRLDARCTALAEEVCSGTYRPLEPARFLSEKSKGLCRQIVQVDVEDALVIQVLSDALWLDIKNKAPSNNAYYAPQDHGFSKKKDQGEYKYGPIQAWLNFQKAILGFSRTRKYIVITDIANFYDGICHSDLRSILADLSLQREHALDLLIFALSNMIWQPDYGPYRGTGLPQGDLDAPRLLAHSILFEVDALFASNKTIDYARYMDDIDFGVDSISAAKLVLRDLDLALQTRGLRLNSGKTQIFAQSEAARYYRIRDNALIDSLTVRIDSAIAGGKDLDRERRLLSWILRRGVLGGAFVGGNGEKILKRCLALANKAMAPIDDDVLSAIFRSWPASRQLALRWWKHSKSPVDHLYVIRDFLNSGELVDEVSLIDIAVAIVSAPLPKSPTTDALIDEIVSGLNDRKSWKFFAKLWIWSKYGTWENIENLIFSRAKLWSTNRCLTRLVAGMFPRFIATPKFDAFQNGVRRAGGVGTNDVLDFHSQLIASPKALNGIINFMVAQHSSEPSGISHSKFLMLISALNQTGLPASVEKKLRAKHAKALATPYYDALVPSFPR